jgi:hypothetical protein
VPFPTVGGKTFKELGEELLREIADRDPVLSAKIGPAFMGLFEQVDFVSSQLYGDVQTLKQLAHARGWEIEVGDPSQAPLP